MSPFADSDSSVEYARTRWEEGEYRVQRVAADSRRRDVIERVVEGIVYELEKRVGGVFSSSELAREQDAAEAWCMQVAHELAPGEPWAWELDLVQNAAFHRYARRASDYQAAPR